MDFNLFQNNNMLRSAEKYGYKLFKFTDIAKDDTRNGVKIKKEDYLENGAYPIIDQGKEFISGYYNEDNGLYEDIPAIIFGDHTRNLKYIDFPIFLGADGVKIFKIIPEINTKYIYYFLLSIDLPNDGYSRHSKYLKEVIVPVPEIDTQNKIVKILDKAQELIDKRKEQIELLDELIQSKFLEMFGNPITNPKGWEVEKINTIAPIEQYKGKFNDGKVWLLNLDMVESNSGRIINYNYVDKEEVGNSTCTFNTDNVLYSKLRPYLNKVAIPDKEGYATSEMIPLKPNREILNREYFAYSLRSKAFVDYISEKVSGAKMPRVVMSDFKDFKFPVPPLALQEEFAIFVGKVNDIKAVLNKSLEQLNNNFDSLISRAFKGELF